MARIGKAPSAGASTETKVPDAVPVANPMGRADIPSMYVRYSSLEAKSGKTSGVSPGFVVAALRRKAGDVPAALVTSAAGGTKAMAAPQSKGATTRRGERGFDDQQQ